MLTVQDVDIFLLDLLLSSSTSGDENFVENKGLLDYSKLGESADAIKPKSFAVSEFHFLLLIGDKVKVWIPISFNMIYMLIAIFVI